MSPSQQPPSAMGENEDHDMSLLPATTYSASENDSAKLSDATTSPDSFYRQYRSQYFQSTTSSLRQGAIRQANVDYSGTYQNGRSMVFADGSRTAVQNNSSPDGVKSTRSHINSPGLRNRKSSVKYMVDQINASSTEDLQFTLANSLSRSSSPDISPILPSETEFQQVSMPHAESSTGNRSNDSWVAGRGTAERAGTSLGRNKLEKFTHNNRPLFGEVVLDSANRSGAGYGIQTIRKRSGSEGSPLPSPSYVRSQDLDTAHRNNFYETTSPENNFMLSPAVYVSPGKKTNHRRRNSESPLTATGATIEIAHPTSQYTATQHTNHGAASRIPVNVRQDTNGSDFELRSPTSSAVVKPVSGPVAAQKQPTANRRPRSPPQIQSPSQRGKTAVGPQRSKSPSLRANIIVPPPKISPPLRSSRPRLPVSSASTAASRAKMAEKFDTLQKMNEDKRQATRKAARPPELSDIDLKARRLRITQALTRSLEGQDLRGTSDEAKHRDLGSSRTASPAISDRSRKTEPEAAARDIPAVVIDSAPADEDSPKDFTGEQDSLREERSFSQNALDMMQGNTRQLSMDDDSPTLGPPGLQHNRGPPRLQTNLENLDRSNEPSSAVTEGTMIDPEPQDDAQPEFQRESTTESILSQIHRLRSQRSFQDYEAASDLGDQESVRIFLRDTIYLDDDEAIRKGYQPALMPRESEVTDNQRSSWVSSIEGSDPEDEQNYPQQSTGTARELMSRIGPPPVTSYDRLDGKQPDASVRSTMASDAYTIVNIVLQQHSTAGIVDQQLLSDVYQRVLEDSPFTDENNISADRIEQICLQEIQDRVQSWYPSAEESRFVQEQLEHMQNEDDTPTDHIKSEGYGPEMGVNSSARNLQNSMLAPPSSFKGHKQKSSLGSAEDWLDASPSISDWMRFAASDENRKSQGQTPATPTAPSFRFAQSVEDTSNEHTPQARNKTELQNEDLDLHSAPSTRKSTPPPLLAEQSLSREGSPFGSAVIHRPHIPRRITSISQIEHDSPQGNRSPRGRQSPSASMPALGKVSLDEPISPEQRRLKQRRNVIKELVDTEFTYEKDLRVLCDIYKQTASAALGEDDIKILFGNVEQVQAFSKTFLMLLKSLAKPTYAMERQDRKSDKSTDTPEPSLRTRSSSSTIASSKAAETETPTTERDKETRIGQAFEDSLEDMEKAYTEYIKNRQAANLRLEAIQKSHAAREWLKECKDNSSDITNAWNLDALLVKPVQRITKYPLLLKELVDATPEDHPDLIYLRKAMAEVTDINVRINNVKKHAELVDQVLNRKRKDSDVRAGLSKAFGRRAEKLKQHVGMTDLYEDVKFNEIKIHYDNNIVQLMVVGNDCSSYGRAITKWVNKMVAIAAAAEAWVDVGHSNHQEAESKLRQFAMVIRGISTIALPDHLEQLNIKVLNPMQQAVDTMTKFKTDPKGLLQKREKRMIDYAQLKAKKERGEKIDRKTIERMEQSEALNLEAKQRMGKLVAATAKLVVACQANLVQMQLNWQGMVRQKLSAAMGIKLEHLEVEDIEKEWQLDFDFQEASALSLGICNGSLLAEASNLVSFQGSTTTLNEDESPPQTSLASSSKGPTPHVSEASYPPIPEYDPRTSGLYGHQYGEHANMYANARARAQSAASARFNRTPELSQHGESFNGYPRMDSAPSAAPRLSVDTESPSLGTLLTEQQPSRRPTSSSTFFSAPGTPPPPAQHQSVGSSIFSSAMPMSDSPVDHFNEPSAPAEPDVLFTAASVYEFNIDRSRREAGFPYLTYVTGEIFDIIGERGELWLAKNQDDPQRQIGWIWNKHFAKLAE